MSWAPAAHAAGKDAARSEWRQGNVAYDLGHYDEAAKHYYAAYTLVQDPVFLFNIAQSYRMAGKLDKALDRYRAFLRNASADAPNRGIAEKFIAELKHQLEEKKETAPIPPPQAVPAKEPAAAAPLAPPPPVATPKEPPAAGPPKPLPAVPPIPTSGDTNLVSLPAPAEQTSIDQPIYKKWWFWTGVGVVVAGGIVTAILLTRPSNNPCSGTSLHCVEVR